MKFDFSTIVWLFFIIAALQPLLRKRYLLAIRQRLIATFEKKKGSRVIVFNTQTGDDEFSGFSYPPIH